MEIMPILIISYLLGSIPFGFLIGKLYGKDITKEGSRNIGATNTFRLIGPIPGIVAFLLDLSKGTLSILLALKFYPDPIVIVLAGAGAIIGHTFSIFMKFKGGKGVAVGLGILLGLAPDVFIICLIWATLIIIITRYVSVASLTGSTLATLLMVILGKPLPFTIFVAIANILIIIKHKSNIKRLLNGSENKIKKNAK